MFRQDPIYAGNLKLMNFGMLSQPVVVSVEKNQLKPEVFVLIHEAFVAFDVTNFVDVKSYNDVARHKKGRNMDTTPLARMLFLHVFWVGKSLAGA